jgi:hypothetical protein
MTTAYKIDASYLPTGWKVGWILEGFEGRGQFEIVDLGGATGVTLRKLPSDEKVEKELLKGSLSAVPTLERGSQF